MYSKYMLKTKISWSFKADKEYQLQSADHVLVYSLNVDSKM